MRKFIVFVVITAVLGASGFIAYGRLFKKPEVQVLETAKAEVNDLRGVLVATGIIKAQVGAEVKIGARATGTIVKMNVKIGDRVTQGQLVALIDDREILRSIEQIKASLTTVQDNLEQTRLVYPYKIKEAKANSEYARLSLDRQKNLVDRKAAAQDAYDKARNQIDAATAVQNRLELEYRTQQDIFQSQIKEITAKLRQEEIKYSYTKIYAPIDGVVSAVTAQEGETIVSGLQAPNLVTVLDPERLELWTYVDETDIGRVALGRQVEYRVDTFSEKTFGGLVEKIYPQPITKDNIVYYLAIVKVTREDAAFLRPEMTTYVKVIFSRKPSILTVPNAAGKFEKGKQIAYKVIGPNKVEKIQLLTGIRGEDRTEIISGLKAGDELATKLILPVEKKTGN
ncbi:MAG: HlyD family efflux transporter periplasmic adaptor subunit [Deltaproteobacteria bacterium]|nr:HlyD family efflux transporter periplasmic adaptor subunit [Deltaproteobacteria bacterium]